MLRKISTSDGVTPTERYLASAARRSFLNLWSYPNTYRDTGGGQELSDLMVVFGNQVILFSDKSSAWPKHQDAKVNWRRWYRSSVIESARQLHGAESFLRKHPKRLYLDKACTEPFPLRPAPGEIKVHLVAVTKNTRDAAQTYYDSHAPGSSASLICNFLLDPSEVLEHPFCLTDVDRTKTFVHILDDVSFEIVLSELDTIADFLHYLDAKEQAVRRSSLAWAAGEEDILGFYLQERLGGFASFPTREELGAEGDVIIQIPEGEWVAFRNSDSYRTLEMMRSESRLWDELLQRFSTAIVDADTGEADDLDLDRHERALRCMADETRHSRALLSTALHGSALLAKSGMRHSRALRSPYRQSRLYVFLVFPFLQSHGTYDIYRRERRAAMELYARVARVKFEDVREVVVLGFDADGTGGGTSETLIVLDASEPPTPHEKEEARKLMDELSILKNISEVRYR